MQITPWRLTIRGCCCNLRRSSREILDKTILHYAAERPECFAPPPPTATAWVPATAKLDAVAADLQAQGIRVHRVPLPPLSRIDPRPVLVSGWEV